VAVLWLVAFPASAADFGVNWEQANIFVQGVGKQHPKAKHISWLFAQKGARVDAQRNFLDTVKEIRLDNDSLARDEMVESDRVREDVSALVSGLHVVRVRRRNDLSVEVSVRVTMAELFSALIPEQRFRELTADVQAQKMHGDERKYSGVVIDATGVSSFSPSLLPWIKGFSGSRIYPNAQTPYDVVRSHMAVAYAYDVESAMNRQERVGVHPLLLKLPAVSQGSRSELRLNKSATEKFLAALSGGVNQSAAVIIVLDSAN